MTHAAVPEADRNRIGVTDGLVRLSVGVEDASDLVADVEKGLAALA
jgi:cystathionine beta-lyase/cystathionine gamma-synthase